MREVICPAIYQHFKGKHYVTMGVSKPIPSTTDVQDVSAKVITNAITSRQYFGALHTELNESIHVLNIDGEFRHFGDVELQDLVIYKTLYDGSGAYARPFAMFVSEVDKEKYPNVMQEYHFERINH